MLAITTNVYADPVEVSNRDDCWFYHTIDVPGVGTIPGEWDLRAGVDDYLGKVTFAGKRVLELGTASGFLCFEMEKRGAEVVAFDVALGAPIDVLPLAAHPDLSGLIRDLRAAGSLLDRLHNSFWFCHRLLGSQAKVVYGNIYDLPAEIGPVDVATFGSILLHLRDPFLALANAARLTRETIIVTDLLHDNEWDSRVVGSEDVPSPPIPAPRKRTVKERAVGRLKRIARAILGRPDVVVVTPTTKPAPSVPAIVFLPNFADPTVVHRMNSWWQFSPAVIRQMLGVLGFEDATTTTHSHTFHYQSGAHTIRLFTVVARRTRPMPQRTDGPYPWH